nr:hypothetical protein [Sphingobium scionense]
MEEIRKVWPEHLPLTARFGVIEFDGGDEESLVESIALVNEFKARGLDMLNVSIGCSTIEGKTPWAEGFMAPYAGRLRQETGLPVATAWCIDGPEVANAAVEKGELDLVMIARAHLADPHYPYVAAQALGDKKPAWVLPAPYAHWLSRYRGIGKAAAQ